MKAFAPGWERFGNQKATPDTVVAKTDSAAPVAGGNTTAAVKASPTNRFSLNSASVVPSCCQGLRTQSENGESLSLGSRWDGKGMRGA